MAIFLQGEANLPTNPKLQLFIIDALDAPIDCEFVGFRILDITTDQNKCYYANQDFNPIQSYPNQGPQYLDTSKLYTDDPAGHKIDIGNYYAPWTAGPNLRTGEYVIVWEWKINGSHPFRMTRQSFAVKEQDA